MKSESSAFRRLAAILTLQSFAYIAATEESAWCSESSFDAVEPQQIIDPTDSIEVAWLNNNLAPGCGQLPRATWTIEPAPEGVDKTLIWMSPPDLGVVSWWSTARGYTTLQGIEFNQTTLNNLSDESDIGVLIQVPKDELQWVEVSYGSPLRINIAPGFSNIVVLKVVNTNNPSTVGNYSCGTDGQLATTGLGTTLRADLSTVNVTAKSRISLKFDGDGIDASIKLPNGYPVNQMKLSGYNSKYSIKGNVNCTGQVGGVFDCYLRGGSADLCTKDCYSQLVVDGSIDGNVAISPLSPALVANVSASDGCNHFLPDFDQVDLSNFICTEGAAANVFVEVQPLPCMIQAREMMMMGTDVVNCPEQDSNSPHKCHCYVPTTATCPSSNSAPSSGPATSPGSIGPLLSNTLALGLAGILLCYNLGVIMF